MMKKLLASRRICFSTSYMVFLSTTMISSWGLWQMSLYHLLSWSLTLLGLWYSSDQGLQSTTRLISKIMSAICSPLKSSNDLFSHLMRRARLLLLMKAFVHWMDSSAKLHPTPPMMTLPLMTLPPMLQSKILKAQLQGWWLIVSFSSFFIRRLIATTNG